MRHGIGIPALLLASAAFAQTPQKVEQWGLTEVVLHGPSTGNPFVDVRISAQFRHRHRAVEVDGFYDGDGVYKIRFMPDVQGSWEYQTKSNNTALDGRRGAFEATPPSKGNHGPVVVRNTYHFGYADGTPYYPVGTTCYAWAHQGDKLEAQTLDTLRKSAFNKMRMCVFPKHYAFNANEPQYYPFERDAQGKNDFTRFNPKFFPHFESLVKSLQDLGIEADLILLHPYDRWGYKNMPPEADERYLRYPVARLAAFRNVWWSLANEWDFMKEKTLADWDRFFRIVQESDPYQRLRSIHNGAILYDHAKPWVTHSSIQSHDFDKAAYWREAYKKPVVYDECQYEGNIPQRWGNISAEELVRRFWLGTVAGTYVGHGETYLDPNDILWWSKGGVLHGRSEPRIAFLRKIIEEFPAEGLTPIVDKYPAGGVTGKYYLYYFDSHQPGQWQFDLPKGVRFSGDIIDTWNMTITPVPGAFEGKFVFPLPSKPHQAARFRRID
jgi:hypothetical protein